MTKKVFFNMIILALLIPHIAFAFELAGLVGNKKISTDAVKMELKKSVKNIDTLSLKDEKFCTELKMQTLNEIINQMVLNDECDRLKITVSEAEFDKWLKAQNVESPPSEWIKKQKGRLREIKLIDAALDELLPVTQKQIEAYYKENSKQLTTLAKYRVFEITLDDLNTAHKVLKKLQKGEDFKKTAKSFSVSLSKENGGDIGFVSTNNFPTEQIKAFESLEIGKISAIYSTSYGYQIFKVVKKVPAHLPPLDKLRAKIIEKIREPKREKALKDWFDNLKNKVKIITYPKNLEEIECYPLK